MKLYAYEIEQETDTTFNAVVLDGDKIGPVFCVCEANYHLFAMSNRNDVDGLLTYLKAKHIVEDDALLVTVDGVQQYIKDHAQLNKRMFMLVPIDGYDDMEPTRISAVNLESRGFDASDIQRMIALEIGHSVYLQNGNCDCTVVRLHNES